jgi:hypothetical protein
MVLDMRYYGASTTCARTAISSATSLSGRGQAPVTGVGIATRARASWPLGIKWKLPPTKLLKAPVILFILCFILVVRTSL